MTKGNQKSLDLALIKLNLAKLQRCKTIFFPSATKEFLIKFLQTETFSSTLLVMAGITQQTKVRHFL